MPEFSRYQVGGKKIPPMLEPVIDSLKSMFGGRLELVCIEGDWLTFRVAGMVEATLLLQLQRNAGLLFGGQADQYQVTCPANARRGEGVSIRYVGLARHHEANYDGFWFY